MEKIPLGENLELSRIIHGHWRLKEWNFSDKELLNFTHELIDMGITTIDTADIYGDYECEALFGKALALDPGLRNRIEIVTKCGVSLMSKKFPERKINSYNFTKDYIVSQVNRSLDNLGTDRIDLLLLHRPSPLLDPKEVAIALNELELSGKVLNFGVSNFTPQQFKTLQGHISQPLVTNQVEISPVHLEHFDNENMDFFLQNKIVPMAWSPLARGRIFIPETEQEIRVYKEINQIAEELGNVTIDKIIMAWLLYHPANILPILGSGKINRIKSAVDSLSIVLSDEQWFRIYIASKGEQLP